MSETMCAQEGESPHGNDDDDNNNNNKNKETYENFTMNL
jgi:hypothetical protein